MYAVVASGGKQYKVQAGDILRVEKLPGDVGGAVAFEQVLMVGEGESVRIGQPLVAGAVVKGQIVEQHKSRKILVFKYKHRTRSRRRRGHRQTYTAVKISAIEA